MPSVPYIQRLQRLYLEMHRNTRTLMGDYCTLVELIDEDDLRNWYVLLRYEDENHGEFFISLRLYFMEELQRMPFVFVISPRLIAAFIHHGAICSLELMSQQWSVDAEGLSLLLRSLHVTLNPFSQDRKVTIDGLHDNPPGERHPAVLVGGDESNNGAMERGHTSAYTRAEHEIGIQYIKQAHPHLFRGYTKGKSAALLQGNSDAVEREAVLESGVDREAELAPTVSAETNDGTSHNCAPGAEAEVNAKQSASHTVRSRAELEEIFTNGRTVTARLCLCRSGHDNGEGHNPILSCTLPSSVPSGPYTVKLRPCSDTCTGASEEKEEEEEESSDSDSDSDPGNDIPSYDGECNYGRRSRKVTKAEKCDTQSNEPSFQGNCVVRRDWMKRRVTKHKRVRRASATSGDESDTGVQAEEPIFTHKSAVRFTGALLAPRTDTHDDPARADEEVGGTVSPSALAEQLLPNTHPSCVPSSTCVIPANCTLCLHNLAIYASVTVLGVLELHNCTFVGCISTEGRGRALIQGSDVYVDGPESRREGIVILDASSVVVRDHTVIRRKGNFVLGRYVEPVVFSVGPSLLYSLITVSNSGLLRMYGGCRVVPYGTDKTIFAEQNATVYITDCSVMAGYNSAVSIQGCHGFFTGTHFYGSERITLQVADANRPTGLNVELGGIVTVHNCRAIHLYFGFSVIAHSVTHFLGCHAEHVVNGYTIDASSATIENSSASTNHVGVYALNKAKCSITNDLGISYGKCCQELLRWRKHPNLQQRKYIGALSSTKPFGTNGDFESDAAVVNADDFSSAPFETFEGVNPQTGVYRDKTIHDDSDAESENQTGNVEEQFDVSCLPSHASATASLPLPLSFSGGLFSIEVRGASMVAKGLLLTDARESSLYVYDQGSLELTDAVMWTSLVSSKQPCAVKVVSGFARVQRCLAADYVFGFAVIQGSIVSLEECMAVGGKNGFTIEAARCTLRHCGADTGHVGVFSLSQSTLRFDNTGAPKTIAGGLPCVLKGRVYGLESRNSDTVCIGVTVQRGQDSGFTCYNKGFLRLERCIVDMSTADTTESHFHSPSQHLRLLHSREERGRTQPPPPQEQQQIPLNLFSEAVDGGGDSHAVPFGAMGPSAVSITTAFVSTVVAAAVAPAPAHDVPQKNSGVKAWSGSHCVVVGCEVQHVNFGYAAIGPETTLEASHCTAKYIENGFTVDSAKCRLSRCSTNSHHVGVFVLSHGTCTVERGSYIARMYGIENRNGIVHIKGHVKLSGFSRIGMYVYDGARLDTEADSVLDIKVHKGSSMPLLPPPVATSGLSVISSGLFPSCFAMDKGNAMVHNAIFGGGAQCAVSCGDKADVFLHKCTADYCNIAFNAMSGSQMYLSDCEAQHVWQHALVVHRGGMLRVSSDSSPDNPALGELQGKLWIDGTCFLERVILRPVVESPEAPVTGTDPDIPSNIHSATIALDKSSPLNVDCVSSSSSSSSNSNDDENKNNSHSKERKGRRRRRRVIIRKKGRGRGSGSTGSKSGRGTSAPSTGLICVNGSGVLEMDLCSILLDSPLISAESLTCAVIIVEGQKANVWLRGVAFVGRGDAAAAQSQSECFDIALQQGAKGDVQGAVASSIPINTSNPTANVHIHRNVHGTSHGGVHEAHAIGSPVTGDPLMLRVHVDRSSFLTAADVHLRQLVAAGGSGVQATRCFFAGADAVQLSEESNMRAVECVFVGAVRGPAVRSDNAVLTLAQCRAYATHGAAVISRHSTITLQDSVFTSLLSNPAAVEEHRAKKETLREGGERGRVVQTVREGKEACARQTCGGGGEAPVTIMKRTAAPTRWRTEANAREAMARRAVISHARKGETRHCPNEQEEEEEETLTVVAKQCGAAALPCPPRALPLPHSFWHTIALEHSDFYYCEFTCIGGSVAADGTSRVEQLQTSAMQRLLRFLWSVKKGFWFWWNGPRMASGGVGTTNRK